MYLFWGQARIIQIPKDISKKGFIIEIKKLSKNQTMERAIESALNQIKEKKYDQALRDRGIKNITHMGIAVENKKVKMKAIAL